MSENVKQKDILQNILNTPITKTVIETLFGKRGIEVIERPASIIIRLKEEPEDKIYRIIILQPHGFTANKDDETNPHPEARKATIEVKGAIKNKSRRFHILKNVIKFQYYKTRNVKITEEEPYPKIRREEYSEITKSSREKFFAVKENGFGFYHSIVNLTSEWVLLILKKELKPQKTLNLETVNTQKNRKVKEKIEKLYENIIKYGDKIFQEEKELADEICQLKARDIIPSLIEMLNILETGKHEACTVYAIILKIGKKDKNVITYLEEAIKNKSAPRYYLEELLGKLSM